MAKSLCIATATLLCIFVVGVSPEATAQESLPYGIVGIGGCGGVYFFAEPGELLIEVGKQDLNRRSVVTELQAIVAGPDRTVLAKKMIPDDGLARGKGAGPWQWTRLSVPVARSGIYVLNILVSNDRYGENILWGFRTNCRKYVIETARGHRDRPHDEPIVLRTGKGPAEIWFLPPARPISAEVTGMAARAGTVQLIDDTGQILASVDVDDQGAAVLRTQKVATAGVKPWCLRLPVGQATVQIDGLTRWSRGDLRRDMCQWSNSREAFFPLPAFHPVLWPHKVVRYAKPNESGEVRFWIRNADNVPRTVKLSLEFPEYRWPVSLDTSELQLASGQRGSVVVRFSAPEGYKRVSCLLRAKVEGVANLTTYSRLVVLLDEPPYKRPLALPIALKPYCHENCQFGYLPDYPTDNQFYFDLKNRPYVLLGDGLAVLRQNGWETRRFSDSVVWPERLQGKAIRSLTSRVVFDQENNVYVLGRYGDEILLLKSQDEGRTFAAYRIARIEGSQVFEIEQFTGHNVPVGPPPVLRLTFLARDERLFWRRIYRLELFLPKETGTGIEAGEPLLLSNNCIGLSTHSGSPNTIVSVGSKVHVAWGEATDPEKRLPGLPAYVNTVDRETRRMGKPVLVAYGAPANDIHNTPSITVDSRGYLHLLAGTHGAPFGYARSLVPNDSQQGWTDPVYCGEGLRQTYIGLVCLPDDTLCSAFRLWLRETEPFPLAMFGTLAFQRKPASTPWSAPRVLILPPFSEYSIYRHRLTIDRRGRLFLSYQYWSTHWFYRNDGYCNTRLTLMSSDGGKSWKFVETADLLAGMAD